MFQVFRLQFETVFKAESNANAIADYFPILHIREVIIGAFNFFMITLNYMWSVLQTL